MPFHAKPGLKPRRKALVRTKKLPPKTLVDGGKQYHIVTSGGTLQEVQRGETEWTRRGVKTIRKPYGERTLIYGNVRDVNAWAKRARAEMEVAPKPMTRASLSALGRIK